MGVMGGKLRIYTIRHAQQFARAGDVGDICDGLGSKHRKTVEALDLRTFYFRVPIRPLDETHHNAAIHTGRKSIQVIYHKGRTGPVGLHNDAEPVPTFESFFGQNRFDNV